ncbi:MAG: hypothetical protein LIO92_10330 [Clostridiales bacterium]|nr:hypothetical protein [Clostridiales bacterium]
MGERVLKKIAEYLKDHRWKKKWQAVLTLLAAVVVFGTTYILILPAVTLEKADAGVATASDAEKNTSERKATPGNAVKSTTVSGDDPEEDGDLIFDLDYDLTTRRSLTRGARKLGIDVDMGVPEWMLSGWDDVPAFDGELTGSGSEDLLAVAESQIGYIADYEGRSYYGDRYGKPYDDWDAMFVSYCLDVAEVPEDVIPRETSAAKLAEKLADMDPERLLKAGERTPGAGELILLDMDGDGGTDRIGIVVSYDRETRELKVIEGDSRTAVEAYEVNHDVTSPSDAEKATLSDAGRKRTGRTFPLTAPAAGDKGDMDTEGIISEVSVTTYTLGSDGISLASEDGEEAEVSGYVLTSENTSMDLFEYADRQNAAGKTTTINYYITQGGSTIQPDASGVYTLEADVDYTIQLYYYSIYGIASGTYTVTLPENVTMTAENKSLTIGNTTVGEVVFDAENNRLIIELYDEISSYVNVGIWVYLDASFEEKGEQIIFDDLAVNVIPCDPETMTGVDKSGEMTEGAGTDGKQHVNWSLVITGAKHSIIPGSVLTDEIITDDDGYSNHSFTVYDMQTNGIEITAVYIDPNTGEDTISISWTVKDEDGDGESGTAEEEGYLTWDSTSWSYIMPSVITDDANSANTAMLPSYGAEGWTFFVNYTSTLQSGYSGTLITFGNKAIIDGASDEEEIRDGRLTVEPGISKTGEVITKADETTGELSTYIRWTLEAVIPGLDPTADEPDYSWRIIDTTLKFYDGTRYRTVKTDFSSDKVQSITAEINGSEYAVKKMSTAYMELGSYGTKEEIKSAAVNYPVAYGTVTKNAVYSAYGSTYVQDVNNDNKYSFAADDLPGAGIILYNQCLCDVKGYECANENEQYVNECGGGVYESFYDSDTDDYYEVWDYTDKGVPYFCQCWNMTDDVTITIIYDSKVEDLITLNSNKSFEQVTNTVQLQELNHFSGRNKYYDVKDSSSATVEIQDLFSKSISSEATSENGYIASYRIDFDRESVEASDEDWDALTELTLEDSMSDNLTFLEGNLVIVWEDEDGSSGELTAGTDYTLTVDGDGHGFLVVIPSPGNHDSYQMSYDAIISSDIKTGDAYRNTAKLVFNGKYYSETVTKYSSVSVTITGEKYQITLNKKNQSGEPLENALFGLYNSGGSLIKTYETDAEGKIVVNTDTSQKVILHEHVVYYLKELQAPTGYERDETPHYFWFCNTVKKAGDDCAACSEIAAGLSGKTEIWNPLETGAGNPVEMDVTNEKISLSITLKKEDSDLNSLNATFRLSYVGADSETYYYQVVDQEGKWVTDPTAAFPFGDIEIKNIESGMTYCLEEVNAPEGYTALSDPITFTADLSGLTVTSENNGTWGYDGSDTMTLHIINTKYYELPKSGGAGTDRYRREGILLLISCAVCLMYKKNHLLCGRRLKGMKVSNKKMGNKKME